MAVLHKNICPCIQIVSCLYHPNASTSEGTAVLRRAIRLALPTKSRQQRGQLLRYQLHLELDLLPDQDRLETAERFVLHWWAGNFRLEEVWVGLFVEAMVN